MIALRDMAMQHGLGRGNGFRWRGGHVSRIEGFSDAAFTFAVTLLVVSLEVPETYGDLLQTIRWFPAFGICFTPLILMWYYTMSSSAAMAWRTARRSR